MKRRDAFPEYGGSDSSCRSGPRKAQRRKFPKARVACGNELSDARAGYDRDAWTAMAAASMHAEDDDPDGGAWH